MSGSGADVLRGRLHLNEPAAGAARPGVVDALVDVSGWAHAYPDDGCAELRTLLAQMWDLGVDQISVGAGSSEVLLRVARACLGGGREVVYAAPGFVLYEWAALAAGGRPVPVPLDRDHQDLGAMVGAVTERTGILAICNPHNPTGTRVPVAAVADAVAAVPPNVVVLIDEAYLDYADDPRSARTLLDGAENVVVLRTFSKAYRLAGLRVGYALGPAPVLARADRERLPFCVSRPALAAAAAALADPVGIGPEVERVRHLRSWVTTELRRLGCAVPDSQASFVLARSADPVAAPLAERCSARGVLVAVVDPCTVRVALGAVADLHVVLEELALVARSAPAFVPAVAP